MERRWSAVDRISSYVSGTSRHSAVFEPLERDAHSDTVDTLEFSAGRLVSSADNFTYIWKLDGTLLHEIDFGISWMTASVSCGNHVFFSAYHEDGLSSHHMCHRRPFWGACPRKGTRVEHAYSSLFWRYGC